MTSITALSRAGRSLLAGLVLTVLALGGAVGAAPFSAADPGAAASCMGQGGIYVYIYYQDNEVTEGCTHSSTGYSRISDISSVEATSTGFICRIGGKPANGPCKVDSTTQVYWTYWWWRNGSWVYATTGGGYRGIAGTAEAWNYSAGAVPPIVPPAPAVTTPDTGGGGAPADQQPPAAQTGPGNDPTKAPAQGGDPATGNTATSQSRGAAGPGITATSDAQATNATTAPAAGPSGSPASAGATPAGPGTASASGSPAASTIAVPSSRKGSNPWPTVATLSLLAAAGAGYGLWTWRKRRRLSRAQPE